MQSIRNLCSAFSYCLSLLDTLYVWHGCGSVDNERTAARNYAKALASPSFNVIELVESQSDADDEMFWMILGEGDYAKADYWKWRASSLSIHPRVWSVDVTRGADAVRAPYDLITPPSHPFLRSNRFSSSRTIRNSMTLSIWWTAYGSSLLWLVAKREGSAQTSGWPSRRLRYD